MNANSVRFSVNENDFIAAHSYRRFPLGYMPNMEDPDTIYDSQYIYVQAGEAITAYQPYGVFGQEKIFSIDEFTASNMRIARLVVPQFSMAPGEYGFVTYKGQCIANVGAGLNAEAQNYIAASQGITDRLFFQSSFPDEVLSNTFGFLLEAAAAGTIAHRKICLLGKDGRIPT